MSDGGGPMPEISRPGQPTRQSIAPSTSAPTAPTMDAPGARTMTDPTPSSSRRREAAAQEKFRDIERDHGRSKYLHHRRDEMRMREGPETPVSDAYVITMRRQGAAPGLVSLDDLVIQSEQREREEWLREEEYRATVLPGQLQRERQYLAQMEYNNKLYAEQGKRIQEQRARDTEAQKYGYETDAELQAAIREEKAIKRANELGLALTEAQLITQTVAREGYAAATDFYGRDPGELIEEQRQIGAAAQASLETNFGIEIGPKPQEYFQAAAAVPVTVREREAAHTRLQGVIDPINAAIEAGTPASELPFLPAGITRMARDAGADPGFDAWAFQYTATVARAKAGDLPPLAPTLSSSELLDGIPDMARVGASHFGRYVGFLVDAPAYPFRRLAGMETDVYRTRFSEHPEIMARDALIGGGIVLGVAGGVSLLGSLGLIGGGGSAMVASGSSAMLTGGGAAMGFAARTAAPVVIEEGLKAAVATGAVVLGGEMIRRAIEFPSGLPDWAEIHKDPHGGVGSEGGEIPLPDWMSGDPEVLIDPGVDWRAPGEPFDEYMRYRRSLPGEGPPGTGPTPYYPGPELTIGGRTIHAPEITPSPDYFNSPERLIGRTMFDPEIKPDTVRKRFAPELPIPSSGELFPGELPRRTGLDTGPTISPDQAPIHPLGDPVSPVWRPPDYTDTLGIVSAGITLPGSFRRSIPHHRPIEPLLPSDGGIHESLRVRPFKTPSKRRKAQKEEEIGYDYTFTPIPPEVPQVTVPGIITPRPDSGITTKFTSIHTAGIEAKARPGVITLSPVKPLHIATPDATAVSGVDVGAGVAAGTLAASVTGTLSGVASASATRPAVATLPRLARPNISRIEYQPETVNVQPVVNITTPIFARERSRRDDRRRRRDKWDEFYLSYAEAPNPLASLEEAYTNLPGPKIRPAKVITNLQRITIGTPPKIQPIRAKAVKVGPPVKRARQKVPWDVTTTPTRRARPTRRQAAPAVNLDFLGIGVAPAKRKRKSKKRR